MENSGEKNSLEGTVLGWEPEEFGSAPDAATGLVYNLGASHSILQSLIGNAPRPPFFTSRV